MTSRVNDTIIAMLRLHDELIKNPIEGCVFVAHHDGPVAEVIGIDFLYLREDVPDVGVDLEDE